MRVPIKVKHLGKTYFVWVDEEDYPKIYKYNWCIAARKDKINSVQSRIDKKIVLLHRFLMECSAGDGKIVDHVDRDPLNNCKSNLRFITKSGNNRNRDKMAGTSSQYPGVAWHKHTKKWVARICIDGRMVHLGYFVLEEIAAIAYRDAILKIDPLIKHDIWNKLK